MRLILATAALAALLVPMAPAKPSYANVMCGIPPIPPIGCRPVCSCDSTGMNCTWTFICG